MEEKYIFSRGLSKDEKKWILESIEYLKSLNIPISKNIYFKHCWNFVESGWCETEEDSVKAECTIALSVYLNYYPDSFEHDFKEVCIHELLHTIKNRSKDPHKGSWLKYAKIVNAHNDSSDLKHYYWITPNFLMNHLRRAKKDRYSSNKNDRF